MKPLAALALVVVLLVTGSCAQGTRPAVEAAKDPIRGKSPDEIWRMATQGELLTSEGWRQACGFFKNPIPFPGNKVIVVMSNDWGPAFQVKSKGDAAEVDLGYLALGKIDSALRYTPAPKTGYIKTAFAYRLAPVPAYLMMMGPDGKTLVEKKPVGYRVWQIEDSPGPQWTTVNTAIRYVLEKRAKTTDPTIKQNADQTLTELLKLH